MKEQKRLWKDGQVVPFLHSLYREEEERKNPNLPPQRQKNIHITVSLEQKKGHSR